MRKIRQGLFTAFGLVLLLFLCALLVPKALAAVYDSRTLDQPVYMDGKVNAYEVSILTFEEKLSAIASCIENGIDIHTVLVEETDGKLEDKRLTEIVNEELERMVKNELLISEYQVQPENLSSRKMYTMYTMAQTDSVQGISFWELVYDSGSESMTVYMDTEFHKIYTVLWDNHIDADTSYIIDVKEKTIAGEEEAANAAYAGADLQTFEESYKWIKNWPLYWEINAEVTNEYYKPERGAVCFGRIELSSGAVLNLFQGYESMNTGKFAVGIREFLTMMQL